MLERIKERSGDQLRIFAPAKINLFLAVNGRRRDGFHDLTTILAKLSIGDMIHLQRVDGKAKIQLECPGYENLENENNLVYQSVKKWFQRTGENWSVKILLNKEIPPMSGLGGGSSDAVSVLVGMNEIGGNKLSRRELADISAEIGSDCPSFFETGLSLAVGRGEHTTSLNHAVAQNIIGQEVLLFRPNIGFSTAEVYRALANKGQYSSTDWVNKQLELWQTNQIKTEIFLHNDLEKAVFSKHIYFSSLFDLIKTKYGLNPRMSGSGSCCFVFIPQSFQMIKDLRKEIHDALGDDTWVKTAKIVH